MVRKTKYEYDMNRLTECKNTYTYLGQSIAPKYKIEKETQRWKANG